MQNFMQYLLQHNCQKKLCSELTTQILGIYTRDLGNIYCMAHFTSSGVLFSSEVPNFILVNLSTSHLSILCWTCRSVGHSTAAFVQAVLEGSTQPGVWFPEEVSSAPIEGKLME